MAAPFARTARSLSLDHAGVAWAAWSLAALLLGGWVAWMWLGEVTVYEVSRRARLEVQQAAHPVAAPLPGKLVATALAIGQEVRAGDVLVELDAGADRLRLQEEQARLDAIPPRIASLRREIAYREQAETREQQAAAAATLSARHRVEEASAAVEFAQEHERRLKEESGFGSVARVEAQRALAEARRLGASRDALASDAQRLASDAQTRASQNQAQLEALRRAIVTFEGEIATVRAALARLEQRIEQHRIRAPIAGRIADVMPLRAGSVLAEGQKLATIVPRGELIVVAEFDPPAVLGRVQPGQSARLRLEGFPWAQYGTIEARVSRVAGEIRDNQVRVEFAPLARPDGSLGGGPALAVQHGLPGAIEVTIERTTPATLLLRSAGQVFAGGARTAQRASEPLT
jgi:membrane fusion protein (multidrug efflux system)